MEKPKLTWSQNLLYSFKQFKLNYFMNKMVLSLTELIRELQTTKGILKDQRDLHMVVNGSLSSSSQKKKNTIETTKHKRKFKDKRKKKKKKKSKSQGKCFLCSKKGHWKKEYPKFPKRVRYASVFSS